MPFSLGTLQMNNQYFIVDRFSLGPQRNEKEMRALSFMP